MILKRNLMPPAAVLLSPFYQLIGFAVASSGGLSACASSG